MSLSPDAREHRKDVQEVWRSLLVGTVNGGHKRDHRPKRSESAEPESANGRERDFRRCGYRLNFHRHSRRVGGSRDHFDLGLSLQDDRKVVMKRKRRS